MQANVHEELSIDTLFLAKEIASSSEQGITKFTSYFLIIFSGLYKYKLKLTLCVVHRFLMHCLDPSPSVGTCVANFSFSDIGTIGACTVGSGVFGYCAGYRRLSVPIARTAMVIGGFAGFCLAYQNSFSRLMGLSPNGRTQKSDE